MRKINDFGKKIGGAKKDIWAAFHSLSDEEKSTLAVKAKIWPRPRYESLLNKGCEKEALFWRNEMRKAVKAQPTENPDAYVDFCSTFKKAVEACETIHDVEEFYKKDIDLFMQHVEDNKWKYANKTIRKFFDGKAVLRYMNHTERILDDLKKSSFMDGDKESKKYEVIHITGDNLSVSPYKVDKFQNTVRCSNGIISFFDEQDYSVLLKSTGELNVVLYDNRKIGVFDTKEKADDAIENHKQKRADVKKAQKKEVFLPPHLSYIERTGSDYNFFRMTDGNVLLARYGLRGGEFGNYTSAKDRLGSINMAYDAFEDLYQALGISVKDVGLGGDLAIAFGARGRGNAMAHYEPDKNVINMTKMRGAGSLAHEWAHAMDAYVATKYHIHGFLSDNLTDEIPDSMKKLVRSMMFRENGEETYFYRASKAFDKTYKKHGEAYWASSHEMLARAFACYVKDKLGDKKSDYLVGHAECAKNAAHVAYPVDEERQIINQNFDAFFEDMIDKNIFTKLEEPTVQEQENTIEVTFFEGAEGQMRFC